MVALKKWRAGIVAVAVAAALAVPAVAFAYAGMAPGAEERGAFAPFAAGGGGAGVALAPGEDGHRGPRIDLAALAAELGVTTETLEAALESARESLAGSDAGVDPAERRAAAIAALATALGMDEATVADAIGEGIFLLGGRAAGFHDEAHLETLATALGVSDDDLRNALQDAKAEVERPEPGADVSAYRGAIIASVAATLGLDVATVEAAFGEDGLPLGHGGRRGGLRGAFGLDSVAETLGVTSEALRAAIAQVKTDLGRPEARADRDASRAAFLAALAQELGVDAAALETALGDGPLPFGGHGRRGVLPGPRFAPDEPAGGASAAAGSGIRWSGAPPA